MPSPTPPWALTSDKNLEKHNKKMEAARVLPQRTKNKWTHLKIFQAICSKLTFWFGCQISRKSAHALSLGECYNKVFTDRRTSRAHFDSHPLCENILSFNEWQNIKTQLPKKVNRFGFRFWFNLKVYLKDFNHLPWLAKILFRRLLRAIIPVFIPSVVNPVLGGRGRPFDGMALLSQSAKSSYALNKCSCAQWSIQHHQSAIAW